MATEPKAPAVEEVHILWISEGMSCDGDSVSITAAGQPGIEDVLLGAIPDCPRSTSTTRCCSARSAARLCCPSGRPSATSSTRPSCS